MRLVMTRLHNICQHRDMEHTWSPRTNLIIGSNGAGKSNLLKAMKYSITGDFDNHGVKEDNACQLAPSGSKSYVVQTMVHEGVEIEITRYLKGGKSQIVANGVRSIGENNVGEALREILGVNPAIVDSYVFVGQGKIFDFIDERPAARAANFQQLFDMAKAEQVFKAISKVIDASPLPEDPIAEIAALKAHLVELSASMTMIDDNLGDYKDMVNFNREENSYVRKLADHQEAIRLTREAEAKEAERDRLIAQLGEAFTTVDESATDLEAITEAVEEVRNDVESAKVALANWKAHRRAQDRVKSAQAAWNRTTAESDTHPTPAKPDCYMTPQARDKRYRELDILDDVAAFVDTFNPENNLIECPTCGTPTVQLKSRYEEFAFALPAMRREFDEFQDAVRASESYDKAMAAWQAWKGGWDARMEAAHTVLSAAMQAVEDKPEGTAEDYEEIVNAFAELEQAKVAAERAQRDAHRDAERIRSSVDRLDAEAKKLWMDVQELMYDDAELDEVIRKVQELDVRLQRYGELRGRKDELKATFDRDNQRLSQLSAMAAITAKQRAWLDYLWRLKGIVHRDNLPAKVSRNYLMILADDVNDLLEQFEASFNVVVTDPLSFVARFPDGRIQAAQRLSGGERVILALAFRVAVNSLFAESVGLLALDEPTQFLDEDHLSSIKKAVASLRDLSDSRGLQCMLITHEPRLGDAFDSVLQLQPA